MKKVFMYVMGCTENLQDASSYQDFLLQNGFQMTEIIEEADYAIFLTCGVTSYIGNECEEKIKHFNEKLKHGATLIAAGCLPFIDPEKVNKYNLVTFKSSHGDVSILAEILGLKEYQWEPEKSGHQFYVGPGNYKNEEYQEGSVGLAVGRLKRLVEMEKQLGTLCRFLEIDEPKYFHRITEEIYQDAYFVNVARGCGGNCSYCAVKFVKGDIQSKPIDNVVKEIQKGIELGKKEIVLSGDDVGSYGRDIDVNFADLMRKIRKVEGDVNYTIRNFEPFWMSHHLDEMVELLSTMPIVSICIPIQSGSDAILKQMRRNYNVQEVVEAVNNLKEQFPHVVFSTHVLVGFPGETDDDFKKTLHVLKQGKFDFIRYAMYTDRPGTDSRKMENKVSALTKYQRMKELEEYSCKIFSIQQQQVLMENIIPKIVAKMEEIVK